MTEDEIIEFRINSTRIGDRINLPQFKQPLPQYINAIEENSELNRFFKEGLFTIFIEIRSFEHEIWMGNSRVPQKGEGSTYLIYENDEEKVRQVILFYTSCMGVSDYVGFDEYHHVIHVFSPEGKKYYSFYSVSKDFYQSQTCALKQKIHVRTKDKYPEVFSLIVLNDEIIGVVHGLGGARTSSTGNAMNTRYWSEGHGSEKVYRFKLLVDPSNGKYHFHAEVKSEYTHVQQKQKSDWDGDADVTKSSSTELIQLNVFELKQ